MWFGLAARSGDYAAERSMTKKKSGTQVCCPKVLFQEPNIGARFSLK